jgi:hypothetical protein
VVNGTGSGNNSMNATVTAFSGSIGGNALITVNPVQLLGLVVSPSAGGIAVGGTMKMAATGLCPDGISTVDNTGTVSWTSSNASVASIDAFGTVSGLAAGSAVITATAMPGSVTANATLSVQ